MVHSVLPSLAWWVHLGFHQKTFVPVHDLLCYPKPRLAVGPEVGPAVEIRCNEYCQTFTPWNLVLSMAVKFTKRLVAYGEIILAHLVIHLTCSPLPWQNRSVPDHRGAGRKQ